MSPLYLRFMGGGGLFRVRGFERLADGRPDLSAEVYTGPWGSDEQVTAELAQLEATGPERAQRLADEVGVG